MSRKRTRNEEIVKEFGKSEHKTRRGRSSKRGAVGKIISSNDPGLTYSEPDINIGTSTTQSPVAQCISLSEQTSTNMPIVQLPCTQQSGHTLAGQIRTECSVESSVAGQIRTDASILQSPVAKHSPCTRETFLVGQIHSDVQSPVTKQTPYCLLPKQILAGQICTKIQSPSNNVELQSSSMAGQIPLTEPLTIHNVPSSSSVVYTVPPHSGYGLPSSVTTVSSSEFQHLLEKLDENMKFQTNQAHISSLQLQLVSSKVQNLERNIEKQNLLIDELSRKTEYVQTKTLELHQKCEQFSKFTNLKISDINSQLHRFFNVGKGPQTNLPISVTAPNTHQWKESSPSFLSPTSTSFHPPSSTALGDDDIISILSDHSLLVNSFSPSNVSMPSKQANTAYIPEKSKEIQREVETSSLSDVYPLSNIAGQWHKDFETSSLPPVLAQSANSARFSADFETSSLSPFNLSTSAGQFHTNVETSSLPLLPPSTNAGQFRTNVETSSLPLLLPPSSNAGQFRTNVETSSLPLLLPPSTNGGLFHTNVETPCLPPSCSTGETSSLCHAFPTNARQFHEHLEATKTPTCMSPLKTVHELLVLHRHELYDLNKIGKVCVALCRDVFFGKRIMAVSTVAGRYGKGRDIQKLDSNKMDELKAIIERIWKKKAEIEHWEFKYEKFESKIWKSRCCPAINDACRRLRNSL